jgi:hypothetical protein
MVLRQFLQNPVSMLANVTLVHWFAGNYDNGLKPHWIEMQKLSKNQKNRSKRFPKQVQTDYSYFSPLPLLMLCHPQKTFCANLLNQSQTSVGA